jgi:hypothetical protein
MDPTIEALLTSNITTFKDKALEVFGIVLVPALAILITVTVVTFAIQFFKNISGMHH